MIGYPTYPCKSCDHTAWAWRKDWEKYECEVCGNVEKAEHVVIENQPTPFSPPTEGALQEIIERADTLFFAAVLGLGAAKVADWFDEDFPKVVAELDRLREENQELRNSNDRLSYQNRRLREDLKVAQTPVQEREGWTGCSDDEVDEREGWQR